MFIIFISINKPIEINIGEKTFHLFDGERFDDFVIGHAAFFSFVGSSFFHGQPMQSMGTVSRKVLLDELDVRSLTGFLLFHP